MARKRKSNTNGNKAFIVIFLLAIVIVGAGFYVKYLADHQEIHNNIINDKPDDKPKEEDYSLSLVMVGDNLIHAAVYDYARKLANYNGYDFKPIVSYIKDYVSNYDLAYYNQETILGGGASHYPRFNSPYEVGDAMIDAGFNMVSLATNHTMDAGRNGVENSCKYWKEHSDILAVGSYCSEEDRNEVIIKEKNNIKYALLNYTYGTNGLPTYEDYYVNVWPTSSDAAYESYKEVVKSDIEKVRDKVDVLIVAMHWGVEYTHTPTNYQKDAAKYLESLGVDIIIGTHPHVIEPVEYINDTVVFYSLGNFLSAQYSDINVSAGDYSCPDYKCVIGLMSSLTINKKVVGDDVSITVDSVKNDLIYTYYNNRYSNFKVIPFSNPDIREYLPDSERVYNKYKEVVQSMDSNIEVVPMG